MIFKRKLILVVIAIILGSCEYGLKKGSEISEKDRIFISELGLLKDREEIILINSQSGNLDELKQAGNFYTPHRIASYWLEDHPKESSINFAYYTEIDSIVPHDFSKDWANSSFLIVYARRNRSFKVYVSGDSIETWTFFNGVMAEFEKNKKFN